MDGRILHCVLYVCFPFYFLSVHHFECYLLIHAILRLSSVVSTLLRYLSSEYAICCWGASVIIRPLRRRPCCSHFGSKSPKNGQMPLHPWSCYPRKGDESAYYVRWRQAGEGLPLYEGVREGPPGGTSTYGSLPSSKWRPGAGRVPRGPMPALHPSLLCCLPFGTGPVERKESTVRLCARWAVSYTLLP